MRKAWEKIIPQIVDGIQKIQCPSCGKCGIHYLYIGDSKTRVGYLQIWCSKCLKGIHISRAVAPVNARFATFDDDLQSMVPNFKMIWD